MNDRNKLISGSAEPFEPIVLLSQESVRNDLGVTDEVAADLDQQIERYSSTFRRLAASRMPRDEVERELAESRSSVTKALKQSLSSGQIERLEQIRLQVRGIDALLEPAMVQRLELTAKQKEDIESAVRTSKDDRAKELPKSTLTSAPSLQELSGLRQVGDRYPNWMGAGPLSITLSNEQLHTLLEALGTPLD